MKLMVSGVQPNCRFSTHPTPPLTYGETDFINGCIGQCGKHDTPTDAVAASMEALPWEKPGYREALSMVDVRSMLLVLAAGSLLVPRRCPDCHGITCLRRSTNPFDETDAVRWIDYLVALPQPDLSPSLVSKRVLHMGGGCTALGAAVKAGHYRCAVRLLKHGASVAAALHDLSGPCAGVCVCWPPNPKA